MKYQRRVIEVEAVQWTAHNIDMVRTICPDAYVTDSGWTLSIPIPEDRRIAGMRDCLRAHVGDYVVRLEGGMCVPMTTTDFEDTYEAAPDVG